MAQCSIVLCGEVCVEGSAIVIEQNGNVRKGYARRISFTTDKWCIVFDSIVPFLSNHIAVGHGNLAPLLISLPTRPIIQAHPQLNQHLPILHGPAR